MQQDMFTSNGIHPQAKIIGLTGSLGSGCTMIAKYLEREKNYKRFKLSDVIRRKADERGLKNPTTQELQDIGNDLRQKHGNDFLVREIFKEINERGIRDRIIVDSIRNTAEVYALRKYVNFYLIAVYAPREIREKRLTDKYKDRREQFIKDDERDSEETYEYGQQVRSCVYLSDILIINDHDFYPNSKFEKEFYGKKIDYYINATENPGSVHPTATETIMTLAYTQSMRSWCLKRKVGAVITTKDDKVITTGYNEVPDNANFCKDEYGMCFRDKIRLEFIRKISFCPKCGRRIEINYECPKCGQKMKEFDLKCIRSSCRIDLDIPIVCPNDNCCFDVRGEFKMKELGRCRALHAEETAIISLPRIGGGVSLKGAKIYTTTFPCNLCSNKIVNTGISGVVYVEPYPDLNSSKILQDNEVIIDLFEGVKSRAYFKLFGNL
jgi:deoxycytidylate deaminase